jgi:hypothetical protein
MCLPGNLRPLQPVRALMNMETQPSAPHDGTVLLALPVSGQEFSGANDYHVGVVWIFHKYVCGRGL